MWIVFADLSISALLRNRFHLHRTESRGSFFTLFELPLRTSQAKPGVETWWLASGIVIFALNIETY